MQNLIITLLACSVTMSALALLYMAITPFLAKRYSAKGRYYAWLVIVIGLIIPFRLQFDNAIVRVVMPNETVAPIVHPSGGINAGNEAYQAVTPMIQNVTLPSVMPSVSWWQIATVAWLAGMTLFLVYHMMKHYRFVKLTKRWSVSVTDEKTMALMQNLKSDMRITKQIELYVCSSAGSPLLIGLLKPRIFIPTDEMVHDELRYILKHELVHYKRKDLLYRYLILVATAIHWFNPVVYLMAREIANLCETSCDAEVVNDADADTRQFYSEAIIGVVKYQSKWKTTLSTNFYGGKKGMKKRISSIMDTSKKKTGMVIICVAIIVTLGTGAVFAANAATTANKSGDNEISLAMVSTDYFEIYRDFGLAYDAETDELYYHGELVRFFEDIIPLTIIGQDASYGISRFSENGTVDVYTVRDFSVVVHHPNGVTDHSGILLRIEPLSQEEFEARDIETLQGRDSIVYANIPDSFSGEYLNIGNGGTTATVRDASTDDHAHYSLTIPEYNTVYTSNASQSDGVTVAERLARYEEFGIAFSGSIGNGGRGNIYYQDQLVKVLIDDTAGHFMTIASTDQSGSINIRILRDDNGHINGAEVIEN